MFEKVIVYIAAAILLISASFFAGAVITKQRLVEQHRMELELSRERAAALTDTLTRAREEAGAIGESLSRQRTSIADLRELIAEIRTRYEKMEELLSSVGLNDCDTGSINDSTSNDTGGEINNEERERLQEQAQAARKVH